MQNQEIKNYVQIKVDLKKRIIPFGEQLRAIRHRRYLSQEDLGKILGISKQAVSRYETGGNAPKLSLIIDYAEKLNVTVDYLLGLRDSEWPEQLLWINKAGKAFFEIFANVVYLELGLTTADIVQITGLSVSQVEAILQEKALVAPLPIALQLSRTLDIPIEVWAGEKAYKPSELSLRARQIAKAYMQASEKDQKLIQYVLKIDD